MQNTGIIIPCYNEQRNIEELLENLISIQKINHINILVVDDGSLDATSEIARKYEVNVISHEKNKGKGVSIKDGLNFFKSNKNIQRVVIIDGDNQHDPSYIRDFVNAHKEKGYNLVIGKRDFSLKSMPLPRIFSNIITSKLISLAVKQKIEDSQSGYRLLDRKVMELFDPNSKGFQAESEMIVQAADENLNIGFVPVSTVYVEGNKSKIEPLADTIKFIKWYFGIIIRRQKNESSRSKRKNDKTGS